MCIIEINIVNWFEYFNKLFALIFILIYNYFYKCEEIYYNMIILKK